MRHRKSGRRLGRTAPHRKVLFSNMTTSLIQHGRIKTTVAKAKELRKIAEKTITWAVSLGSVLTAERDKLSNDEKAKLIHHIRMAKRVVKDRDILKKLFDEVGPRFVGRPGGYTRIIKTSTVRRGDAAPMAYVELLPEEETGGISTGEEDKAKAEAEK